jgi:hypothetical protein
LKKKLKNFFTARYVHPLHWCVFHLTHEYVYYELEFDLNDPHFLSKGEIWKLMVPNIFEDVEEETLVVR